MASQQKGEKMNKEEIIKSMEKGIYYFINKYQIPFDEREDVYQQCVVKILTSLTEFDPQKGKLECFLMARIRGVVKDWVRKNNKKPLLVEDFYIVDENTPDKVIENQIILEEEYQRLKMAIEKLSPMQHKVITLKYFYNLSMSEIAIYLGIHYSTVAKYHSRGLKGLKKLLS
ncbi:Sigma-70 region 2 [Anaerobranca californiensis DSM 14826]|uniref:Sigma-70 region 2 n=1 Tax=Anaerobranca californiensis DSM 14826 TaxID=1120989 RepID=A0A1M6LID7_9FIRM|nr:sigma-70 family RNA polymerase sigma factor [Anaerobranca californiensis]SHJ70959.1 Sigma-70 region 2 [Anaerobranca californiensis DSM 14826]